MKERYLYMRNYSKQDKAKFRRSGCSVGEILRLEGFSIVPIHLNMEANFLCGQPWGIQFSKAKKHIMKTEETKLVQISSFFSSLYKTHDNNTSLSTFFSEIFYVLFHKYIKN